MNKSRFLAASLLAATAFAMATPAAAQRVGRIVAFGDSYADTGNLFRITGASTPVYPTGRFSGGTNYIDTLSQLLGVPVTNYAIGGATTSTVNVAAPLPLGYTSEVGSFLAGGGSLFPAGPKTFAATDLLALSVGGNDARLYQQSGGTVAGAPAAANVSVANFTANTNALVNAGARNISYIALNAATAPEVAASPAAQAVRGAFSSTFNAGIQAPLAGYAANGVIVNYLDVGLIGNRIIANPSAFGLTSAGACPPAQASACVANPTLANSYLFYVDQLHLTSAGFAIVGQYVDRQLTAPLTLQASGDVAIDTARQFGRTLSTRMDLGSPRDGDTLSGVRLFAVGDSVTRKVGVSQTNDQFKVTSVGGTIGLEVGFGSGTVGIAGNYSRPKATFGNDAARVRSTSYQVGGFAAFGVAGGFAQGYLGYGHDKHRITRAGVIDDMTARPSGNHWAAGAKAGYLMPLASLRVGPVIGVDYARAKVNGYTESGDSALTLNVDSEKFNSLRGSAGLELRGDFGGGGVQVRPFAAVVAEREFNHGDRTLVYAQTSAPLIVNSFPIGEASRKTYVRASGGFSAAISNAIAVDAGVSATFGKKQGNETAAQVGVNFGF